MVQIALGDGRPYNGVYVRAYRQRQDISGRWVTDGSAVDDDSTDNAGVAEFSLSPGQYIVRADLVGYNWGDAMDVNGLTNVSVAQGQITTLQIAMGRLVVGFRYGDGTAVKSQYVRVYRQQLDVTGKWVVDGGAIADGVTENSGTITFNLVPGYYIVRSDFTGYNWGNAYDVQGMANFAVPPGVVTPLIRDLGQLIIGLVGSDGQPQKDTYVRIYLQGTDLRNNPITDGSVRADGSTDNAGMVRFNLTPGLYVIRVADKYTYNIPLEAGKITQWDGANATVQAP